MTRRKKPFDYGFEIFPVSRKAEKTENLPRRMVESFFRGRFFDRMKTGAGDFTLPHAARTVICEMRGRSFVDNRMPRARHFEIR